MKKPLLLVALIVLETLMFSPAFAQGGDLNLLWFEDFNGSALDMRKWTAETGTGSQYGLNDWGNNEKQYYKPENALVQNGVLTIRAKKERNGAYAYTSARLTTQGKFNVSGGRVEARIKMPRGRGMWPAFWMLGEEGGTWPANGEIDIAEMKGGIADKTVDSTIHFGTGWEEHKRYYLTKSRVHSAALADDWHIYGFEWTENSLRWLFDGEVYHEVIFNKLPAIDSKGTAINQNLANIGAFGTGKKFYLLLNLAVGGNYLQNQLPDDSVFDDPDSADLQRRDTCMQIDWIKVWSKNIQF